MWLEATMHKSVRLGSVSSNEQPLMTAHKEYLITLPTLYLNSGNDFKNEIVRSAFNKSPDKQAIKENK